MLLKTSLRFCAAVAVVLAVFSASRLSAAIHQDPFPVCDSMRPNVAFWKKVYAEYPSTRGLIHDNRDLAIIYEVIDLVDDTQAGCESINQRRVEQAKEKYRRILLELSSGHGPSSEEEKRVLALFGGRVSQDQLAQAADNIRFQRCLKDRFRAGLVRSGAYLGEIKRIFRSYGLPEDLAYLPHVESSFNYQAYSKFGAAGIWQFTESTGRRYLNIDYTLDERRDPIRATHAAARFLKENHEKLGSWPLAITAYNHGPGGMAHAKNELGSYENILNNYDGKLFGFASRNFYSEFIAAKEVAQNYQKYFGNIALTPSVSFVEVTLPGYAPVKELSRHYQVDLLTLKELNPGLRSPVFEGRKHVPKGYLLRLPGRKGTAVRPAAAPPPDQTFAEKQRPSRFYQVRKGDSASGIAAKYGVKVEDLRAANGLDARATVYAGQNLLIPTSEEKMVMLARAEAAPAEAEGNAGMSSGGADKPQGMVILKAGQMKKAVAKKEAQPPQAATPVEAEKGASGSRRVDKEKPGRDTVVRPGRASDDGQVQETVVQEEQAGIEQGEVAAALPASPLADPEFNQAVVMGDLEVTDIRTVKKRSTGFITVQVDETLSRYAGWLKTEAASLRRLNGLPPARDIKLGQRLKIEFGRVGKEQFEEQRYEYHKEIEEDFFAVYKIEGARLYHIKAGDNIWRLCQDEFDLPLWLVRKVNSAHDFANLKPDEQLIIPTVAEIAHP